MNFTKIHPVMNDPFPHVLVDDFLGPETYRDLAASFPECGPNSGPTGYTLFWGDEEYDALIETNAAWRGLFEHFHSQAFIDLALAQFSETFAQECTIDLSNARYVPYQESRAEKERGSLGRNAHAPDDLWVRVDIMQGRAGYTRAVHLDHRRRAISALIYMSDADECAMTGGELVLNRADGSCAVAIAPKHNRMVMFPCTATSLHSVPTITGQNAPRNFVQVTVSSSADLWEGVDESTPAGTWGRVRGAAKALLGRVR